MDADRAALLENNTALRVALVAAEARALREGRVATAARCAKNLTQKSILWRGA
jgi:hypothetical protein